MPSENVVIIMGNMTRDIELRHTRDKKAVCDLGIAVNSGWGDKKKTTFLDVTVWEKTAEACERFLKKGDPVYVRGRLEYDTWEDKDGSKRSKLRVVADRVQFLRGKTEGAQDKAEEFQGKSFEFPEGPVPDLPDQKGFTPDASAAVADKARRTAVIDDDEVPF